MSTYTPVIEFSCTVCGGRNILVEEGNPEDKRYKCRHHGLSDDEIEGSIGEAGFEESGIGIIKENYNFEGFYIVKDSSAPMTLVDNFSKEEADILDLDEHAAYSDYFEVVLKGRDMGEVADERDVVRQTVYSNVRHARKMLSEDDDNSQ